MVYDWLQGDVRNGERRTGSSPGDRGSPGERSSLGDHMRSYSVDSIQSPAQRPYSLTNGDHDFNESHEEENYSNQVREASHRTLRLVSRARGDL